MRDKPRLVHSGMHQQRPGSGRRGASALKILRPVLLVPGIGWLVSVIGLAARTSHFVLSSAVAKGTVVAMSEVMSRANEEAGTQDHRVTRRFFQFTAEDGRSYTVPSNSP